MERRGQEREDRSHSPGFKTSSLEGMWDMEEGEKPVGKEHELDLGVLRSRCLKSVILKGDWKLRKEFRANDVD